MNQTRLRSAVDSLLRVLAICCAIAASSATAAAAPVRHTVASDGHPLALWEKRAPQPRRSILLIHGRTWSTLPNFDLRAEGVDRSVMDAFARAGYAVYALDQRGYGATPRDATGWLTPSRAAQDVNTTLRWIRERNSTIPHAPVLLGYSRGASVAMLAAQSEPDAMSALVLYALALPDSASPASNSDAAPARRPNTADAAASDFITPEAVEQRVIDAYVRQALESDPVRVDWRAEDEFALQPERIRTRTLLVYGARDPFLTRTLKSDFFERLGVEDREFRILPNSDHAAHVEKSHEHWVRTIVEFVEQGPQQRE